jgi:hypothetical protein
VQKKVLFLEIFISDMFIKNYLVNKYIYHRMNKNNLDLKKVKQVYLDFNLDLNYNNITKIHYHNKEFLELEKHKNLNKPDINKEIALKNLFDLNEIFKKYNQKIYVSYGTLLGFYREKNFIKHDIDTDCIIFSFENLLKIFNTTEFKNSKFKVGRISHGYLSSVFRNGEFIDLYFFEPINYLSEPFFGMSSNFIPKDWKKFNKIKSKYLYPSSYIDVCGYKFETINSIKDYLIELYGHNWQVPLKDDFYNQNY